MIALALVMGILFGALLGGLAVFFFYSAIVQTPDYWRRVFSDNDETDGDDIYHVVRNAYQQAKRSRENERSSSRI